MPRVLKISREQIEMESELIMLLAREIFFVDFLCCISDFVDKQTFRVAKLAFISFNLRRF